MAVEIDELIIAQAEPVQADQVHRDQIEQVQDKPLSVDEADATQPQVTMLQKRVHAATAQSEAAVGEDKNSKKQQRKRTTKAQSKKENAIVMQASQQSTQSPTNGSDEDAYWRL